MTCFNTTRTLQVESSPFNANISDISASGPCIYFSNHLIHRKWTTDHSEEFSTHTIIWNEKGHGHLKLNGNHIQLKTNQFIIIPPHQYVEFHCDGSDSFLTGCIHFTPHHVFPTAISSTLEFEDQIKALQTSSFAHKTSKDEPFQKIRLGSFTESPILKKLCELIHITYQRGWSPQDGKSYAELLIRELKRYEKERLQCNVNLPLSLRKMIVHIQENFTQPIQIDELSKIGNCSRTTVFRLFETYLSSSPIMYTAKLKIEKAKDLLLSSNTKVAQIASELGFSDAFYFSKFFKKHMGVSPSQFRK